MKNASVLAVREYLYKEEAKLMSEQAVKSLVRAILEPVVEENSDALVLMRVLDTSSVSGLIRRATFANSRVYAFGEIDGVENIQKDDDFEQTEFVLVLSNRYLSVLVWDYSFNPADAMATSYFLLNSKSVTDIYKLLMGNSVKNFDSFISKFGSERRENELMNTAVRKIIDFANDVEKELVVKEVQTKGIDYALDFDKKSRIVGHEIKNHLSVIDLYTKIIEKRTELELEENDSISNAIKSIRVSIGSISAFLDNLKEFSDVKMDRENISSIIESAISLATPRAMEKNVEFIVKNDCTSQVFVDAKKLQNVFLNIFYNAIDAIECSGKIKITVFQKDEDKVKILVEDTGKGIDKEVLEEIFKYGFTTKETGSGLGLHIAKISMLAQEGSLRLLDTDSDGTIFEIRVKAL